MSHREMSRVSNRKESWVVSRMGMRHVTQINETIGVIPRIEMRNVTHTDESRRAEELVMSSQGQPRIGMSYIT